MCQLDLFNDEKNNTKLTKETEYIFICGMLTFVEKDVKKTKQNKTVFNPTTRKIDKKADCWYFHQFIVEIQCNC